MNNYFRITAYNPENNIGFIADSYGKFEKIWQFSSYLIQHGCKIIEVNNSDNFLNYKNLPLLTEQSDKIIIGQNYYPSNRRRTNELSSTSDRRQKLSNRSYGRQTIYTRRRSAAVTTVFLNNNFFEPLKITLENRFKIPD